MNISHSRIISIDPGERDHCGTCIGEGSGSNWNITKVDAYTKQDLFKILETITPEGTLVIFETYKLYDSKKNAMVGNQFETVQVIGVIKYICEKRGIPCISSETTNKAFFTNQRLKDLGFHFTVEHKRDAIRHFLYYLYFTAKICPLSDLVRKSP